MSRSDKTLGGRELDWLILEKLSNGFEEEFETDINPKDDKKLIQRMIVEVEKGRIMLSGDVEARINVDNLLDDEDLEKDFTLKEFEELISGYKQRLVTLIQETLQELQEKYNFNKEHLWRIELLGDTSRTPCFMKIIKDEFAMADLNRTMHS